MMCFVCIVHADAAVRGTDTVSRTTTGTTNTSVIARAATTPRTQAQTSSLISDRQNTTTRNSTNTVTRNSGATARSATSQTVARNASPALQNARGTSSGSTARSATSNTVVRSATTARSTATTQPAAARTARAATPTSSARATTIAPASVTNTFGTGYNQCRDAYFTCMDQFCATANDSYRRCICSSRLTDIQERERALSQASDQLQDFQNLNLSVIDKTAAEVNAMISASAGESAIKTDTSESAQTLAGISEVLNTSKSKSLSTLGTLDIAGDINQIWATTDLASGQNIANLTGEALYNAVHAQCVELVADSCNSSATLTMVVSAYGMYIENDCTTLANSLNSQLVQANSTIRGTEREMQLARLDNYNAHNSTSINDCIAQVRADITADTACGKDYVHCLDVTGRYLNRDTGEPIYSPDFYQLGAQISLSGDVLNNSTNRLIVAELNSKRIYAQRGLETCRDIADEVWDEFLRQAITEIYQGQQEKIRTVKNECLDVVNACYDQQSNSLKDFSNIKEELLLGSRLELSEELCQEKLYACSNLYGDPNGDGLNLLVNAMQEITEQKIAQNCKDLLTTFTQDFCTVPSNDNLHTYPYGCRVYSPGEQRYASIAECNLLTVSYVSSYENEWINMPDTSHPSYTCDPSTAVNAKDYSTCSAGYYLAVDVNNVWEPYVASQHSNALKKCILCPTGAECAGGTSAPVMPASTDMCGTDYAGSLYQKVTQYAYKYAHAHLNTKI